ncbi:hypothetical protein AB0F03_32450 [Streptomyces sp. NPDC028722]|uniref:hypothetical protein n=1 Tax=Streptomyces sp. NPDC028722 TaxID=3155016 RepID=UPI0033D83750
MALGVRLRRDAEALDLDTRRVGHTLLVHPKGELNAQSLAFAGGLPADPDHQVVVLDLPPDPGDATWAVLARLLGRGHPDGYRLVMGRALPDGIVPVGQWLADRLDRAVVVPDGAMVPAAGGVLYIPAGRGPGWVRLLPRRPPTPVSRRFPKPAWEFTVSDEAWRTSDRAVVDPLPSGVWLHGGGREDGLSPHRGLLVSRLAYRPDLLTVVLGCPGGDALSLDDVSRFWHSLLPGARDLVRFVAYGPLAAPDGPGPGQALADRLDVPVTFDNGLPVSHTTDDTPEVHALDADGSPGWAAFARQLRFTPARFTGGRPTSPQVVGHRPVFGDLPEIAPGRYRYDEAVLEVVPSGLWLRPSEEPDEAAVIRSAAPSARHVNVVLGTAAHTGGRMRELAERLLQRLDPALRALVRLVPAAQMVRQTRTRELTPGPAAQAATGTVTEPTAAAYGADVPAPAPGTAPAPAAAPAPRATGPRVRLATAAPVLGDASAERAPRTAPAGATHGDTAPAAATTAGATPPAGTASTTGPAPAGDRGPLPPLGTAGPGAAPTGDTAQARESAQAGPAGASFGAAGFGARVAAGTGDAAEVWESAQAGSAGGAFGAGGPGAARSGDAAQARESAQAGSAGGAFGAAGSGAARSGDAAEARESAQAGTAGAFFGAAGPGAHGPGPVAGATAAPFPGACADGRGAPASAGSAERTPPGPPIPPEEPAGPAPDGVPPAGRPARSLPPGPPLPSVRLVSAPGLPTPGPVREPATPDGGAPGAPGTGRRDEGADAYPRATPLPSPAASAPSPGVPAPTEPASPDGDALTGGPEQAPDTAPAVGGGRPVPPGAAGARVQAVPSPAACAVPPRTGIAREREWMRNAFRQQYNDGAGTVARLLSEAPGLRGSAQTPTEDILTDLVAARLYLRGDSALLDRQIRGATVGPHVPLARCVAAGLRRLPSYRGATVLRAALGSAEWDWYRRRTLVTEWAFCWALTAAAPEVPGDTDLLIWSMTARRTALLDPGQPARVLFLPGTAFKLLAVRDGDRRTVLLRELSASEISADGRVDTGRSALDDMALSGLEQADRAWQAGEAETAPRLSPEQAVRFTAPPGLVLPAPPDSIQTPAPPGKRTTP